MTVYLCGASAKDYFHFAQVAAAAIALACSTFVFAICTAVLLFRCRRQTRPNASLFTINRAPDVAGGVLKVLVDDVPDYQKVISCGTGFDATGGAADDDGGGDDRLNATVPQGPWGGKPQRHDDSKPKRGGFHLAAQLAPGVPETSIFKLAIALHIGHGDPAVASGISDRLRAKGIVSVLHLRSATLAVLEAVTDDPVILRKLCYMVEYADLSAELDDDAYQQHSDSKPYG